jgi:hypothetical protein
MVGAGWICPWFYYVAVKDRKVGDTVPAQRRFTSASLAPGGLSQLGGGVGSSFSHRDLYCTFLLTQSLYSVLIHGKGAPQGVTFV